jgi:hypothetical protein
MTGEAHKIRGGEVHLPLIQWQDSAITIITADVNPKYFTIGIMSHINDFSKLN